MNGLPDEISLVNAALARFGAGSISGFAEDSELAGVCVALYRDVVDAVLSRHRWTCLDRTTKLQRLATAPDNGYRYAFEPPADAFTRPKALLQRARPRVALRDFRVEGSTVCADAADIWGVYGRRLSPDQWPPELRLLITAALAADLVIPVCEDANLAAQIRAEAFGPPQMGGTGGLFAQAIAADHASAPPNPAMIDDVSSPLGAGIGYSAYPADWYRA